MKPAIGSILVLLMASLGGCADLNSIHRQVKLPYDSVNEMGGEVITVDAKQRHLLISPDLDKESGVKWRMCAEAAPDVFSAYAASGSAKGGTEGKSVSAEFGFSGSETAATIERTQAINLLRESMYRTCERYLSGAISRPLFITQAARDQRSMIAFLAIEQLTRAARPPAIVISGPATSASIKDGEAAAAMVESFRKTADSAQAAAVDAQADLDKKSATAKCLTQDAADKSDDAAKQADLSSAFAECVAAKAVKTTKDAENKIAQDRLDQALKLAADTINSIAAATQAGTSSIGAGGGGLTAETAQPISEAVVKIAAGANINEPLMFCIGLLSERNNLIKLAIEKERPFTATNSPTDQTCLDIITRRAFIDDKIYADQLLTEMDYTSGLRTEELHTYLGQGTDAERRIKIGHVREALRYLNRPSSPKAVIALTGGGGDPTLQATVLAYIKARYPD